MNTNEVSISVKDKTAIVLYDCVTYNVKDRSFIPEVIDFILDIPDSSIEIVENRVYLRLIYDLSHHMPPDIWFISDNNLFALSPDAVKEAVIRETVLEEAMRLYPTIKPEIDKLSEEYIKKFNEHFNSKN